MPLPEVASRREFLKATAAASAAAPLLAALAPHGAARAADAPTGSADSGKPLRKAVKIGMVKIDGTLLDKFKLLADCGFDGVDLMAPANEKNTYTVDDVLDAQAKTGVVAHGVVDSVHWKQCLTDPDAAVRAQGVEGLLQAIRDAKAYGGTTVLLVPGVVDQHVSYAQAYERSQAEIRKAIPLARELQIRILIENVWNNFLLSPLELATYLDAFEAPDVMGSYFDVGNMVYNGWPEQWIRILGKRIGKLDIKEFSRKKAYEEGMRQGFDVELLEGDCNWPAVMAALKEIGYRGWGTAEIPGGGEQRLREIAQRMDRIFAYYT